MRRASPAAAASLYFAADDPSVQNPRSKGKLASGKVPFFHDAESSEGSP
jgi:hypothetical protein